MKSDQQTPLVFGTQSNREVRNDIVGFTDFKVSIFTPERNGEKSARVPEARKVARQIFLARSRVHRPRVFNGHRT